MTSVKLKLDEKGAVVVQDGKPVYVADDGKEIAFDYTTTLATITRLNSEAKGHRERAETAETALKGFEGIADPAKAIKALELVQNIDDKKLIDAGQVQTIKDEAKRAFDLQLQGVEEKYKPVVAERDTLKEALRDEKIGGAFSRSKFIGDKLAIPPDLVQARFGRSFEIDDNKIVAKDATGNRIFSRARPGEIADFDEALETLVDQYPYRDNILKGSGASGGGAGGSGGANGGKRTITRAQFDAMDPLLQRSAVKEATIVD